MITDDPREDEIISKEIERRKQEQQPTAADKLLATLLTILRFLLNPVTLFLIVASCATYIYFKKFCDAEVITIAEIRYYIVVFLFICFVLCFSVLRIFNAIVANTSYLLKFKGVIKDFTKEVNRLHTNMQNDSKNNLKVVRQFELAMKSFINFIKK